MKTRNKALAMLLSVAMLISIIGFTAYAAESTEPVTESAAVSTNVFDGYNVTILDKTTPAADMRGRTDDRTVMCFVSADDTEIGVISYNDYRAIIEKKKTLIRYPDGSSLAAPPDGYTRWHEWFADEFNKLRNLDSGSREVAIESHVTEITEEYRQEIIKLVNEEREQIGLPALYADEKAMEYAQVRAQELIGNFSHTRPNGLEKPFDEIGAINENISIGQTPENVMKAWMDSPGHRANILNDDAFAIGVGCHWTGAGYYWTQEFLW